MSLLRTSGVCCFALVLAGGCSLLKDTDALLGSGADPESTDAARSSSSGAGSSGAGSSSGAGASSGGSSSGSTPDPDGGGIEAGPDLPANCTSIGTFDTHRYALCGTTQTTRVNWFAAGAACAAVPGWHLVSIASGSENAFIEAAGDSLPDLWIGYSDVETEGSFVWSDGAPNDFTSWGAGFPTGSGPGAGLDCVYFEDNDWFDEECSDPLAYVCEHD